MTIEYAKEMQGKLILAARALLGWSQPELERRAGVSHATLVRLERDSGNPRRDSERRVVEALQAEGIQFEEAPGRVAVALVRKRLDVSSEDQTGR